MIKNRKPFLVLLILGILVSLQSAQNAVASESCPKITWNGETEALPKVFGIYYPAVDQFLQRIDENSMQPVSKGESIIGCYAAWSLDRFLPTDRSWNIGIIDRDSTGFYWKNGAGRTWRLNPDFGNLRFTLGSDYPYLSRGKTLEFDLPFNSSDSRTCQIKSYASQMTPGFSRTSNIAYGKREIKFKVLIPEFSKNSPININSTYENLKTEEIIKYYQTNSYGKLRIKFELTPLSSKINNESSNFSYKSLEIMKETFKIYSTTNPGRDFDGLIFALPKEYINDDAGFADSLDSLTGNWFEDAKYPITWIGSQSHNWDDKNAPPWKVLAHEIGHNLGLADLYAIGSGSNFDGKTIGPFDLMGSISAKANELLFWNRWLLGWLPDKQVYCAGSDFELIELDISPVASDDFGNKGVVVPLNRHSAILIESRKAKGYDSTLNSDEQGIVVYKLDTTIPSGKGPIIVIPKVNSVTTKPYSYEFLDKFRFLKAPLQYGDSVDIDGFYISNISKGDIDRVLIASPKGLPKFQEKLEKIRQELKANSEAKENSLAEGNAKNNTLADEKSMSQEKSRETVSKLTTKKTIFCVKGKSIKKISAITPKCPAGYKKK